MAAGEKRTSPWIYIGCGCAAIVVLGFVLVAMAGFFGFTKIRGYVEDLKDPELRRAKALEILHADELPEGYHAHVFFSIPMLLDMVMLSDGEPPALEDWDHGSLEIDELGKNTFIYVAIRDAGEERRKLRSYLAGESEAPSFDLQIDLDFRSDELLSRGTLADDHQVLRYAVYRGRYVSDRESVSGIYTMAMFDCTNGGPKLRLGIWFQRLTENASEPETASIGAAAETPAIADEATLRAFLANFRVCGG